MRAALGTPAVPPPRQACETGTPVRLRPGANNKKRRVEEITPRAYRRLIGACTHRGCLWDAGGNWLPPSLMGLCCSTRPRISDRVGTRYALAALPKHNFVAVGGRFSFSYSTTLSANPRFM